MSGKEYLLGAGIPSPLSPLAAQAAAFAGHEARLDLLMQRFFAASPRPGDLSVAEMTARLEMETSHPLAQELMIRYPELRRPPAPALVAQRQQELMSLVAEFGQRTNLPVRYTTDFFEWRAPGDIVPRRTNGVNIRRVAMPDGSFQVQVLVEPRLLDNPVGFFRDFAHDFLAYYGRGGALQVPRGMPGLADMPQEIVITGQGRRWAFRARSFWHSGRILEYCASQEVSIAIGLPRILADPAKAARDMGYGIANNTFSRLVP
jgi:hypothetical protein